MLAKANRVVRGDEYRATVRYGRRVSTGHILLYVRSTEPAVATRFGFIVTKAIGNAVTRNLVRRRLKAVSFEALAHHATGSDVVMRALPGCTEVEWSTLHDEVLEAMNRGVSRT
jgi:ribonuclease P protein component